MNLPQETLDAVLENWKTADIPERTRAALRLLEGMTLFPRDMDRDFIKGLKMDGLNDLAIREAANVGFHYNLINRVADAFDFPTPEGLQKERLAKMLNFTGRLLKGSTAKEAWVRADDGRIRPPEVDLGRQRVLSVNGVTTPTLRRSVEAYVTAQWGHARLGVSPLPDNLESYLKKLSLHAYKITDDDFAAIKKAGYTDEMLYEITIVGSVGAALVGLELLYEILYE